MQLCQPNSRKSRMHDVAATMFRMSKFLPALKAFHTLGPVQSFDAAAMRELADQNDWTWSEPEPVPATADNLKERCHLVYGWTYPGCVATGRLWLDIPDVNENRRPGCHQNNALNHYYGNDLSWFDMERWKKDPFCLRINQTRYFDFANV